MARRDAATHLEIELPGLGRVLDIFEQAGKFGETQLKRALSRGAILLQRAEREEAPRDTSNLAGNINIIDLGPMETMISPKANYAEPIHNGRLPGNPPPASALESWARRKGLNPYAVSKSIGQKGTKPNPFVARALENSQQGINDEFDLAADKIQDYISNAK